MSLFGASLWGNVVLLGTEGGTAAAAAKQGPGSGRSGGQRERALRPECRFLLFFPEQHAVDELMRASLQQVEIDAQVILYLEMTQVRCSRLGPGTRGT